MPVRDDRRLYFNDHHNQDDGVTFKRTRCKWGLVWLENSQPDRRGVDLHNFTFYSDVSFASFTLPSKQIKYPFLPAVFRA